MNAPRLLPLIGVAVGGVIAVKLLSGVSSFPELLEGAKAFAEGKPAASAPAKPGSAKTDKQSKPGDKPLDPNAPVLPPGLSPAQAAAAGDAAENAAAAAAQAKPRLACTPSATDLAREAGLSPSELQVLQSLGQRRGQLDQREADLQIQLQLMAAAEGKVDAKLKALAGMKAELKGLLDRADQQNSAELDRLVTVYSAMKPKDAAQRLSLLGDSVRIPIAAKMKERALSAIIANMSPADAKDLTEKLARRFESQAMSDAKAAVSGAIAQAPAAAPTQMAANAAAATAQGPAAADQAQPQKQAAAKKPRVRGKAAPAKLASAAAPDKPQPYKAAPPASAAAAPAAATPAPAKAG